VLVVALFFHACWCFSCCACFHFPLLNCCLSSLCSLLHAALLILLAIIFLVALVILFFVLAVAFLSVCYFSLLALVIIVFFTLLFFILISVFKMLDYLMDINFDGYSPRLKYDIWLIYFLISLQDIRSEFFLNNNKNKNLWITNGWITKTHGYWKKLISAQHSLPPGLCDYTLILFPKFPCVTQAFPPKHHTLSHFLGPNSSL
jgi:hypothetical protein